MPVVKQRVTQQTHRKTKKKKKKKKKKQTKSLTKQHTTPLRHNKIFKVRQFRWNLMAKAQSLLDTLAKA